MTDGGHDSEMDRDIQSKEEEEEREQPSVDVDDDESRNSASGPRGNDAAAGAPTTCAGYNPQILRRPSRHHTVDQSIEDDPLPVQVKVELDVGFQPGVPIPDLPYPSLDSSFSSKTFDEIRRLILILDDHCTTPHHHQHVKEVQVNEEVEDLLSSEEEEFDDEGQGLGGQGLFAVDSLKFFLGNIRFDDVTTMT